MPYNPQQHNAHQLNQTPFHPPPILIQNPPEPLIQLNFAEY